MIAIGSITKAVQNKGIPPAICGWITKMFKHTKIYASSNNETVEVIASGGCPHGEVLSLLLWWLVVDDLLQRLNDTDCNTMGYADDITIFSSKERERYQKLCT